MLAPFALPVPQSYLAPHGSSQTNIPEDHVDKSPTLAHWGTRVLGVDCGDGWVQVDTRHWKDVGYDRSVVTLFLPTMLDGVRLMIMEACLHRG